MTIIITVERLGKQHVRAGEIQMITFDNNTGFYVHLTDAEVEKLIGRLEYVLQNR